MIKTVIFDLGGVLIDWEPRRLFRKIFDDEKEMEYFLTHICSPDWNEQQDAGRSFAEATQVLLDQYPDYAEQIRAYYDRWTEMLGGAVEGTVEILKKVHAQEHLGLFALTNWSAESFPYAFDNFSFLHWFEGILVSGKEKMKKPDPRIYQLILERYSIDPATAIFIDDSLRNVHGAEACGIQSIHFQSPEQLEVRLKELGVI